MSDLVILGAGATGLGAGLVTGAPVFERSQSPGGICTSYYLDLDGVRRDSRRNDEEDFRFEIGGGHWIFGGNQRIRSVFDEISSFRAYRRRSSVYLPEYRKLVPYPIQEHLDALPLPLVSKAIHDLERGRVNSGETMADWMRAEFGDALYDAFFGPFHALYTSGLSTSIAPQDRYKTPAKSSNTAQKGYNAEFLYPENGLDELFRGIAAKCNVRYGMTVSRIDTEERVIHFENGDKWPYTSILSTLPLHLMLEMTDLLTGSTADPFTSVLVLNVAAHRGPACPEDHWIYVPESRGGFHRVGVYDNVDRNFLPTSMRRSHEITSMYIEKSYPGGYQPTGEEIQVVAAQATAQLQEWGFIGDVLFLDPTFINTAYTWTRPGSDWVERSLALLEERGIHQAGRFARWKFQGIAASFQEGMDTGRRVAGIQAV